MPHYEFYCERCKKEVTIDRASYRTGHGLASQISAAYSTMVRSLENLPEAATFRMAFCAHPFGSA